MTTLNADQERLWQFIVELLDIPPSHYEQAEERYRKFGEWLHRPESTLREFDPQVYLQGSFLYGTVNRPLFKRDEYDLDMVCELRIAKGGMSQSEVKRLLGNEVRAYAERYGFREPAEEKDRCWRLNYADHVSFHMDILPCVPEDKQVVAMIRALGVPMHLAATSVAITDRRHERYTQITHDWYTSNPRGLGEWFQEHMRPVAEARIRSLVENRLYASITDVPAYEWKTPLQQSIQLLKRHRDVMFRDNPEWAPISMIITVLAARAYLGEPSIAEAIHNIVDRMPQFVGDRWPRIPNPVNPGEDFADRWARDRRYEENFWTWHAAVQADIRKLPGLLGRPTLSDEIGRMFRVDLTADQLRWLQPGVAVSTPAVVKASPVLHIASAPRPWQDHG